MQKKQMPEDIFLKKIYTDLKKHFRWSKLLYEYKQRSKNDWFQR